MNLVPGFLYSLLVFSSLSVNKYVLSTLGFKYPTIFQGWQSFAALLIYKFLNVFYKTNFSLTPVDKSGFVSLAPGFLFLTTSLISNSKALADIPIPIFISVYNSLPSGIYLLDRVFPKTRPPTSPLQGTCALVALISGCVLMLSDIGLDFQDSAYFWLVVGVICSGAHTLHCRITDARYSAWDRLFYAAVFSVVLLAPASFYLEEAFDALNFQADRQELFLTGCLGSALFVAGSNLYSVRLKQDEYFGPLHHFASAATAVVSIFLFPCDLAWWQWILVGVNNLASITLPSHLGKDEDETAFTGIVSNAPIVQTA